MALRKHPAKHDKHGRLLPVRPKNDRPFRNLFKALETTGISEGFQEFLANSENDGLKHFGVFMLSRPGYSKDPSPPMLARDAGVSFQDIVDALKDYTKAEGFVQLLVHLPQVMGDVAQDAKAQLICCERCDGKGEIAEGDEDPRTCPICKGKCEIRVPGDKDARNFVGEAAGIIGKRGPLVAFQQNIGIGGGMGRVIEETDKILEGK